jgi:hypothetical protein
LGKKAYQTTRHVRRAIDGLQPEKGHETVSVVRERRQQRVGFAAALGSSATDEIRPLLVRAREWAKRLGRPVRVGRADKQEAFVTTSAEEFAGVPHRYGGTPFVRDRAKPRLEWDSHAKGQMRSKIRGLRGIEREVLKVRAAERAEQAREQERGPGLRVSATQGLAVGLDSWAAVRGLLTDRHGGPLRPPGGRRAEARDEGQQSLRRHGRRKKGGRPSRYWRG